MIQGEHRGTSPSPADECESQPFKHQTYVSVHCEGRTSKWSNKKQSDCGVDRDFKLFKWTRHEMRQEAEVGELCMIKSFHCISPWYLCMLLFDLVAELNGDIFKKENFLLFFLAKHLHNAIFLHPSGAPHHPTPWEVPCCTHSWWQEHLDLRHVGVHPAGHLIVRGCDGWTLNGLLGQGTIHAPGELLLKEHCCERAYHPTPPPTPTTVKWTDICHGDNLNPYCPSATCGLSLHCGPAWNQSTDTVHVHRLTLSRLFYIWILSDTHTFSMSECLCTVFTNCCASLLYPSMVGTWRRRLKLNTFWRPR